MPQLTRNDIANLIGSNTYPHNHDGVSNAERVNAIVNVFGRTLLEMESSFPYDLVIQCQDTAKVQASIYLATLQHQYHAMIAADGHCTHENADMKCAWLHLWIKKMDWHLTHLKNNQLTPPFPFLS